MPIAFIIVPIMLGTGVFGALAFASRETEDMSPAEQTKRLNTSVILRLTIFASADQSFPRSEAAERLARDDELRKKILDSDVSREAYRESVVKKNEESVDL